MEYLIPLVLVLILVGGFVTFLVLNATRRGRSATRSGEDGPPGIGRDRSPLGDTTEHAGEQTEGRTVGGQDSASSQPVGSGYEGTGAAGQGGGEDSAHVRRSGEGEGTERLGFEGVEPPAAARARKLAAPGAAAAGTGDDASPAGEEGGASATDAEAPREPDSDEAPAESDPDQAPPQSERLADRGF